MTSKEDCTEVIEPSEINLNIKILLLFVKNIFKIKRDTSLLFFIFSVYQYSRIEYYQPSIVITFIDNSSIFQWISRHYSKSNFFAIQNGNRSKKELTLDFKNNLTTFFTFGDYEKKQYYKYGHNANVFAPVGSFISAIYCNEIISTDINKYDICLVSQHKLAIFNDIKNDELKNNLELIDNNLSKYLTTHKNLSLLVLCRYTRDSDGGKFEQEYFNSVYGQKAKLYFQDNFEYSTYKGMAESSMIISCYSTSATEASGWGKKVLFCDYSKNNIFADYKTGIWLTTNSEYNVFSDIVTKIISMDKAKYKDLTGDYFNHIMNYDRNISTIDKIRDNIFHSDEKNYE
ncbi:MAG TPA: hypothetical protein EYQ86_09955 [Bacteroidetes bacterium]|nr:hypothetical protein [Bacteroidota bacterium]